MRSVIALAGGLLAAAFPLCPPALGSTGGGAYRSPAPVIAAISCRTACADAATARAGSLLRVKGTAMRVVVRVTFVGGRGPRDDVTVPVAQTTPRSVVVRVPLGARTGRLRVRTRDGTLSAPSTATVAVDGAPASAEPAEPLSPAVPDRDTSDALDGHVDTSTVFYDGTRRATLRYQVTAPGPVEVLVQLLRGDGTEVRRWTPGAIAPGVPQRVGWDGKAGDAVAPEGRYEFRVSPLTAAAAQSGGEPPLVADSFRFLDHKFPVRGPHQFGTGVARFGARREGHVHQGQDVFAACGTPLVAARGGVVRWKAFQANAGNYLVIDGDGTGVDYAYMHLQAPALVERGARVATGQRIGSVGDTGDAVGCHLHFEMWSAPGWYEGGAPFDPLAELQAWDRESGALTPPR